MRKEVKFYTIKKEIRILGIDDAPFKFGRDKRTMLIGVVFRGGSYLDGVLRSDVEIDGVDATEKIIDMVKRAKFKDLRVIMLDGLGFGGFNLVDIEKVFMETSLPVIVVVRKMPDLNKIKKTIAQMKHSDFYLRCIEKAGVPREVETRKGKSIYIQYHGLKFEDAERIVKISATRSLIPEPIRVAHLIASGIALGESKGGA